MILFETEQGVEDAAREIQEIQGSLRRLANLKLGQLGAAEREIEGLKEALEGAKFRAVCAERSLKAVRAALDWDLKQHENEDLSETERRSVEADMKEMGI